MSRDILDSVFHGSRVVVLEQEGLDTEEIYAKGLDNFRPSKAMPYQTMPTSASTLSTTYDLAETFGEEGLFLARIAIAVMLTRATKSAARNSGKDRILKPWAEILFTRLDTLKFLCYINKDSFPAIIPIIQYQATDSRRLAFSPVAFGPELNDLKRGMPLAVFGLTMAMEDVLVRGTFAGFRRYRGITLGCLDNDWGYNSMPPKPGRIYPLEEIRPVVNF